jgi:hypothetical protein
MVEQLAPKGPFREDDPAARFAALCDKRDALLAELKSVEGEISRFRPWSWTRFLFGLLLLPGLVAVFVAARL